MPILMRKEVPIPEDHFLSKLLVVKPRHLDIAKGEGVILESFFDLLPKDLLDLFEGQDAS